MRVLWGWIEPLGESGDFGEPVIHELMWGVFLRSSESPAATHEE
jgi:hypothetical protein